MPLIKQLLDGGLGPGQLMNINIPDLTQGRPKGVCVVPQATRMIEDEFSRHRAPDGKDYFWLKPADFEHRPAEAQTDLDALSQGYVTITPLHFDLTKYALLKEWGNREWKLEAE